MTPGGRPLILVRRPYPPGPDSLPPDVSEKVSGARASERLASASFARNAEEIGRDTGTLSETSYPPHIAAYRRSLRHWWTLTAEGPQANLEAIAQTYQEILRLIDEVGEPQATRLRRGWARDWHSETGVCPFCGERGPYHDPDLGGESA